jgi:DNA polymerase V
VSRELTARCGLFGISEDHLESYQSLDQRFVKNKTSTYFFEAEGESMAPLILPGDVLVVDRVLKPTYGRIVIVVYDEELVCKRLVREHNRVVLRSENPRYPDLLVSSERALHFWGVVRAIIHPLIEREGRAD